MIDGLIIESGHIFKMRVFKSEFFNFAFYLGSLFTFARYEKYAVGMQFAILAEHAYKIDVIFDVEQIADVYENGFTVFNAEFLFKFVNRRINVIAVKIYCVSDFRLPANDITTFLTNQNLNQYFDGIFSSCEAGCTKKEGAFYSYVLAKINASPSDCVMIGDNFMVDCVNAVKQGISASWAVDIK